MSNKAAWITAARTSPLEIKEAEMPKAGANEVVVKNHAAAINPVDWKIQDYGIFLQKYPNILGTDVAGEVHEVGEGVMHVKKGDRVLGHAFSLITNAPRNGAFQTYTVLNSTVVSKIPSSLSYTAAAVLPLSISTASLTLFQKGALGLTPPSSASAPPKENAGKSVLVWGGSSSVGASAIQLAAGAGLKVVSVAGKSNIAAVKTLGAAAVFDHTSPTLTDDILKALEGTTFAGVSDCIGSPESAAAWTPIYKKLGGKYGSVIPDAKGLPEGIGGTSVFAPMVALKEGYVGAAIWAKFVPEALEKGTLKAKPDAIVVEGKGLEDVQKGLDRQKKGVSFRKVVVEL
ncbi:GroES-like protein [Amniculicola lignicola CBS 123094]|uniref:GroES-like protein n=1 Tax=Amniculicola lignicola CBS 123094 TaxID=1392246 RepID=A0A6A5WLJ0_9PLEO|nr:GroES-like protein [Amniculicola lignicola CBS 123094]